MTNWILGLIFLFSATKSWAIDPQTCQRVENDQYIVNNINSQSTVSTINYEHAQRLFKKLENARYKIPYLSARNYCESRAHIMSYTLFKEDNLSTVKVFLETVNEEFQGAGAPSSMQNNSVNLEALDRSGQYQVWNEFHTAPALCVRKNGKDELYIFDLSLFSGPVPYSQWRKKLAGKLSNEQVKSYTRSMYEVGPISGGNIYRSPSKDFSTWELEAARKNLNSEWGKHVSELFRLQNTSPTATQSQMGVN